MAYTDEAMLSVLQKAEDAFLISLKTKQPGRIHLEGQNEKTCCHLASEEGYIEIAHSGDSHDHFILTHLEEMKVVRKISKLREAIQDKKHASGKTKIHISMVVSIVSVLSSVGTLWIVAQNHYTPPRWEQPIRIVNITDFLPVPAVPDENED